MKFKKPFERFAKEPTPGGTMTEPEYMMQIDEYGHKVLKQVGETNTQDYIQSFAEETDIYNIIRRATEGDMSALSRVSGQYIDVTDAPRDMMQLQNYILSMHENFNALPLDVRAKFDHSPEQYIMQFGSDEWGEKIGIRKVRDGDNNEP